MEDLSLKELLYFIVAILGGSLTIIYRMFTQIQNSKIAALQTKMDTNFKLLTAELKVLKSDIKKEIHDEIGKKHEHLLGNIKNIKNLTMDLMDEKYEEIEKKIEKTGDEYLKIIKNHD